MKKEKNRAFFIIIHLNLHEWLKEGAESSWHIFYIASGVSAPLLAWRRTVVHWAVSWHTFSQVNVFHKSFGLSWIMHQHRTGLFAAADRIAAQWRSHSDGIKAVTSHLAQKMSNFIEITFNNKSLPIKNMSSTIPLYLHRVWIIMSINGLFDICWMIKIKFMLVFN